MSFIIFYITGDTTTAQSTLQHCIDQDQTYSDAHILMAQVTVDHSYNGVKVTLRLIPFSGKLCTPLTKMSA